ncbi:hypothetical protein [Hymenobacter metallilatus]|uniref:Uncharacterized protein n=1 Tax=Hymenobacter metallilatus TaxID=2493666 RepID=A0A428IZ10_9BACT|nr:hypothetical protein [Hymenobacter metallilatus]RSK24195.1 hypothetical protein EI290_20660 [Hymenobacter metallilatus]
MQKSALFSAAQIVLLAAMGVSAPGIQDIPRVADGDLYIRKDITSSNSGIVNLIDSNTSQVVGVSSFDKKQLPAGQLQVIESIRFAYGTAASNDTDGVVKQTYSNKMSSCPDVLIGAHLIINQSGKKLIEIPVQRLLVNDAGNQNIGDDAYYLQALRLLQPQTDIEIQLKFPDGLALASGPKHFVELFISGPRTA